MSFDVALIQQYIGIVMAPVWCTKIASKLIRTYTDRHGLKDLAREVIGQDISKQQQSSDWGAETLSEAQIDNAVFHSAESVFWLPPSTNGHKPDRARLALVAESRRGNRR